MDNFPHHQTLPDGTMEEAIGIFLQGSIGTLLARTRKMSFLTATEDTMTSLESTAPYSASDMRDFSGLLKQVQCTSQHESSTHPIRK